VSSEQPVRLPEVQDVMVSTAASLVNLAGIRLTEREHRNPAKAKEAIEAARALLPLCPEEAVAPIKDALAQIQLLYVKEQRGGAQPGAAEGDERTKGADERAKGADERAKARAKIWTPPGS